MEYHKDQYWVPCYLFSMLMIFQDYQIYLYSILFADDTILFIEGHSYAEVIEILNNELLMVSDWLMANKLTINLEKSHYMISHRSRLKDCDKKNVIIQDRINFSRYIHKISRSNYR